jgi:uncharacterized iron-regulated protein
MLVPALACLALSALEGEPYRVFRGDGTPAQLADVVAAAAAQSVVFLGESHDDATAHKLQNEIFRQLVERRAGQPAALSLEMFERDVQIVLDEYLAGLITEEQFLAASRPWRNYRQDYRPLVEFAREKRLPVIAANAPRRYVNRVARDGQSALAAFSAEAKAWFAPLPYAEASPAYAGKFLKLMDDMRKEAEKQAADKPAADKPAPPKPQEPKRDPRRSLESQSLWDATMAHSIARYLEKEPAAQVVHLNGSFHSAHGLGILDHLRRYRPGTATLVVTMVSEKSFPDFDAKEMTGLGDFVIVTDPALPRSYTAEPPKAAAPKPETPKH